MGDRRDGELFTYERASEALRLIESPETKVLSGIIDKSYREGNIDPQNYLSAQDPNVEVSDLEEIHINYLSDDEEFTKAYRNLTGKGFNPDSDYPRGIIRQGWDNIAVETESLIDFLDIIVGCSYEENWRQLDELRGKGRAIAGKELFPGRYVGNPGLLDLEESENVEYYEWSPDQACFDIHESMAPWKDLELIEDVKGYRLERRPEGGSDSILSQLKNVI